MKRLLLLLTLAAASLPAQDWAKQNLDKSPRHREWVTVKHDGRSVETFVVYPEAKGKTPVVLMIHEIFGLTDWVQDMADQLAAAGYIVVAPDLLSGMGQNRARHASFRMDGVSKARYWLLAAQVIIIFNAVADFVFEVPPASGKL